MAALGLIFGLLLIVKLGREQGLDPDKLWNLGMIAIISGIKGEVRLHAVIAKDGKIQSLTVVSGHPLLAAAAHDAVMQWRYRPYLLNGEPVEVETFITVSFKGTRD